MSLDKITLKAGIKQAFQDQIGAGSVAQNAAIDNIATKISDAIDVFVKGATVTVSPGIPVATAGTAAAQVGTTTGPGTGVLS